MADEEHGGSSIKRMFHQQSKGRGVRIPQLHYQVDRRGGEMCKTCAAHNPGKAAKPGKEEKKATPKKK